MESIFFGRRPSVRNIALRLNYFATSNKSLMRNCELVGGRCVATLAMLTRNSKTSKPTTRNTIAIGLFERHERRSHWAVSFPNIVTYGKR